jgi:hypothetical protein
LELGWRIINHMPREEETNTDIIVRIKKKWYKKPEIVAMLIVGLLTGGGASLANFSGHLEAAWQCQEAREALTEKEQTDVRQIKNGMRALANEVEGQEWRAFRIEQKLNIQDDPPRRLQFDWENSSIIILTNLPSNLAFLRVTNVTINDP